MQRAFSEISANFFSVAEQFHSLTKNDQLGHSALEVYRIRISGLESGRIQHILNKPDRIRTTVLLKFPDQDQDFQISFFGGFDANTNIKRIFVKI